MENCELEYKLGKEELILKVIQNGKCVARYIVNDYLTNLKKNSDFTNGITFINSETGLQIMDKPSVLEINCSGFGQDPSGYLELYIDKSEKVTEEFNKLKADLKCLIENDFELF